jgi:SAM-dependent methyltransferase
MVDLYNSAYEHYEEAVLDGVRRDTYGEDIGQTSWLTADEYERLVPHLELVAGEHVLEVASGSGGPALDFARRTGCQVTAIDVNEGGVANASRLASEAGLGERVRFRVVDANAGLPFEENAFDGIVCIDAMNHLTNRLGVLREWRRILKTGRRALFTDPVVVTGPVTKDELEQRSSIGDFLFVPPGVNERLLEQAGLRLVHQEDGTENAVRVSWRWRAAREARREALMRIEGQERFEGLQRFLATVHLLTSERRLSRIVYVAEKAR